MLWGYLPGPILEPPRWVGQDRAKGLLDIESRQAEFGQVAYAGHDFRWLGR
jgi:hypothetical protein